MNPDVTTSNSGVVIPVLDPRFDDVSYYRNNSKTVQGYYGLLSNFYFVGYNFDSSDLVTDAP